MNMTCELELFFGKPFLALVRWGREWRICQAIVLGDAGLHYLPGSLAMCPSREAAEAALRLLSL